MARAKREIPHYYLSTSIGLQHAQEWLRERNRSAPVADRLVPAALLLRATVLAAAAVPELNGHWIDEQLHLETTVHLGVAVSLRGGGLVAPAIHRDFLKVMDSRLPDYDKLLTGQPIWKQRLQKVGYLPLDGCLQLGVTGPILRCAGLEWDLRKVEPYCVHRAGRAGGAAPAGGYQRVRRADPATGAGDHRALPAGIWPHFVS